MIRPTLRQLDYLIALDHEKSFSKAALARNVTQSTLSAGIKELEDILSQQLVNRAGRIITLTTLGTDIVTKAQSVLNEVDSIVARAQQLQAPLSGTLRLGVIPTIAPYFLPRVLPLLQNDFPNLDLHLYEDLSAHLIDSLHKRHIDAAIIAFPYETEGLETHMLFQEPFYLAAPKGKNIPNTISIQDINPEQLLLLEDGHCLRDHALSACKIQLPSRQKTFSATSLATLIQMVGHGYGVTLLPEMVVKYAPMPENITLTPFSAPTPKRQIGIAWHKHSPHQRDLLALLNVLRQSFA